MAETKWLCLELFHPTEIGVMTHPIYNDRLGGPPCKVGKNLPAPSSQGAPKQGPGTGMKFMVQFRKTTFEANYGHTFRFRCI